MDFDFEKVEGMLLGVAIGDSLGVCLQKVLDKSGIKIGEGFRFPNTFYRSIKQPLMCNYTSFAEVLCFS